MQLSFASCGLAALLLVLLGRYMIQQWRRQAMIRIHGCQPVVQYPSTERFNRDYDRIIKKSFKDGTMNKTAMEQYEKCGSSTFEVRAVDDRVIVTCDVENMKVIHTSDDWVRQVRPASFPFHGKDNILNQIGPAWRHSRTLINPLFKIAELRELENFQRHADQFVEMVPRDGQTHDLQPLIRRLFLDHTSESVFGESLDSLRKPETAEVFMATFRRAHTTAGARIRPTGLKLWLNNLGTWDREWLADCKVVHDFIDERIARYRDQEGDKRSKRFILIEGMSEHFPDPIILRSQLLGIFAGGVSNGAMLFSNCLFLLARNPDVWTELHDQAVAHGSDCITFDQLQSLRYFRYTVQETLRIHTPVPRTRRTAARDTVLPRGGGKHGASPILVKKGTTIWGDRYPASFDPEVWGDDVDTFRPDRFEGRRLGWEFYPFGGGLRHCPARPQVYTQCTYLLFRLAREFERIENRDPCLEFVEGIQMVLESKNGCKIALLRAHGEDQ